MKHILVGATENGAGNVVNRTSPFVVSALVKYRKTNTGTCTLEFKDNVTGHVVATFTVGASNPDQDVTEVALPNSYYAEVSSASGTFALDVWVDGDA